MERNDELIDLVVEHIRAHPEEWNQYAWVGQGHCGTQACFAGWTLLLSGFTLTDEQEFRDPEGEPLWRSIPGIATSLLGLNKFERHLLFHGISHEAGQEALDYAVAQIKAGLVQTDEQGFAVEEEMDARLQEVLERGNVAPSTDDEPASNDEQGSPA